MCIFPVNRGDQVGRAAEGPDLPSGGNAQGLVVCGNETGRCQACKVKQGMRCHLNGNVVKLLSFMHFIL